MKAKNERHQVNCWINNNVNITTYQNEGLIKNPVFVLCDGNEALDLSDCTNIFYKSIDTKGKVSCVSVNILSVGKGEVELPINGALTENKGVSVGEIVVQTNEGTLSFGNINIITYSSVENKEIEKSDNFTALTEALSKVAILTPEGTVAMDTELSDISVNPLTNKAITQALKKVEVAKANKSTTLEGYGINNAYTKVEMTNLLNNKVDESSLLDITKSINLSSLEDTEQTTRGVTVSVKNNKISLSGTSTSAVNFVLKLKKSVVLEQGKAYCLSLQNFANIANGGCVFYPANGQTAISSSWLLSEVSAFKNAVATYTATENVIVNSIKIAVATNRLVDNSCNLQLEQNNKRTAYSNPDLIKSHIKPELYQAPDYTMHYLYVSNDYNETTEGFGVTKFNSILSANDSFSDNSYHNRYTIVVMAGTYTDMQDKFAGMSDVGLVGYRGVMTKDYVYYESENIYNPQATVIKWDGATGFDKSTLKSEDIIKKCPFHLDLNVHTHIKGFTFDCKNIRYALHLESGGTGYATEWTVANCIFKWGGRADCVDYSGKTTVPVFGCGHSFGEVGLIENCKIIPTHCTIGYQNHDNADNSSFGLHMKTGSNITIRNCDFGGTEIQARTLKGAYSDTPSTVNIEKCINISEVKKMYSAPAERCDWKVTVDGNEVE
nr:MAG TPA: BppU domain protein [Caudoviricetes sp.]